GSVGALAVAPSDPNIIYVGSGEGLQRPDLATGDGVYKSTDAGKTWTHVGLEKGGPEKGGLRDAQQITAILVDPKNPNRVFVAAEGHPYGPNAERGVFRSDDAGETWKQVNADRRIGGRGPGAMGIAVAPDNPDVIYVANTTTWKSTDGGKTFVGFKGAPGGDDYQRIWISAENSQIIALSSDQGAVISVNGGATWSTWYNQPTGQFYHVTTDNRFPYWVYGAQQESGSVATLSRSDFGEITFRDWHLIGIFEYGYVTIDPLDPNILYGDWLTRTKQNIGEYAKVT